MSRIDLRWIWHHPLRFLRVVWFHLLVAGWIYAKAILVTDPLWDVTATAHLWPIVLGIAATMCVASAIALSHHGLQRATAYTLFIIAATRALTYVLLIAGDETQTTTTLAWAFLIQWGVIATFATRWQVISTAARWAVTTQAGEDALGRLREAG